MFQDFIKSKFCSKRRLSEKNENNVFYIIFPGYKYFFTYGIFNFGLIEEKKLKIIIKLLFEI